MGDNKINIGGTAVKAEKPERKAKEKPVSKRKKSGDTPYDISFPENCPVQPLGINGDDVFFLDALRQLRVIKADKLNKGTIMALFCDVQDLKFTYWPRWVYDKDTDEFSVNGWRPEQAADSLYQEASKQGVWEVFERVRGPGSWMDADGKLIMHCGDILYHDGKALTPSAIGKHVYPSHPSRPRPGNGTNGLKAAAQLESMLATWSWRRPDLDPYLLMGWIGAAILGGALKWRPMVWITGDKATGKSTLHDILKGVLGDGGLIPSTDATAAGLWQTVGHASLPVALDELEAEADNRKQMNIIKLARQACSGGQTLRGSSDHKNASFTVRSCFLFSSILIPPLPAQDISRMAILQLEKLGAKAPPKMDPKLLTQIGDALREHLMAQWHRFPDVMHTWLTILAEHGHEGRSADQFGTLMACYDLLTSDGPSEPEMQDKFGALLDRKNLSETEEGISDHERCVSHLLTAPMEFFRNGERRTVGAWIQQAAGKDPFLNQDEDMKNANRALGNIGLMVKQKLFDGDKRHTLVLYVANDHQGLSALFKDTHWTGHSGTDGVWVQAMRRINGNRADQQRFAGVKKRCTAIPIDAILGDDEKPAVDHA